jgi:hypothetical protein
LKPKKSNRIELKPEKTEKNRAKPEKTKPTRAKPKKLSQTGLNRFCPKKPNRTEIGRFELFLIRFQFFLKIQFSYFFYKN